MKTMVVIFMTILFDLSLISGPSFAEIYKWVDEKGTTHFTEDPATIPEKYRDKAKSRETEEDLMTPEQKAREKRRYEDEVRKRLKKEKGEYDLKEFEKRVNEMEDQAKKRREEREEGKCEIISYSQYDVNSGDGTIFIPRGGSSFGYVEGDKETCVDIVIQNKALSARIIQNQNIVAHTQKGNNVTPKKGVLIQLAPGQTYRGAVCFGRRLTPIVKMELRGL